MPIKIRVLRQPSGSTPIEEATLPDSGGHVGRHPDCELVLDDPGRRISARHLRIEREGDALRVTDLSSNGTFVDASRQAIGRGQSASVAPGTRFRCGEFLFEATLASDRVGTPVYGMFVNTGEAAIPKPFGESTPHDDDENEIRELVLLRGFLDGMNLEELGLPSQDLRALGHTLGHALREAIQTAMIALRGRAEVKQELGLGGTRVQEAQNNPLKFSPDADEAIQRLFGRQRRGYLEAADAFAQARRDLELHTEAVTQAMYAAVEQFLRRLDPDVLESRLPETEASKHGSNARSRLLWARFRDEYAQQIGADPEQMRSAFAAAFAREYRDWLKRRDESDPPTLTG